jgi:signal transduction histidine kinase
MKTWLASILLLLMSLPCFAQTPSAETVIISQQQYIDHVNDVVYDIYLKSPDSARDMAEKMLLLSEKIKYPLGVARSYANIGVVYWSLSYYPIALFYYNAALQYVPKGHPLLLSEIYSNLGRVYTDLGNYQLALSNLTRSEKLAGTDKLHLGESYSEESYTYSKLHDYDKAISMAKMSLKLNIEVGELMGAAIDYSRVGDIYYAEKNYTRALAYEDTAYQQSIKLHMNRLRAGMYLQYAIIYNDRHEFNKGMDFAKKGISLYDSLGTMTGLSNSYKALIVSLEGTNDLKHALYYERKYNHVQDSLNTIDKLRSTQLIQNYFSLNSRLNDLAQEKERDRDNNAKIKFQHTIINILIVSLVFFIGALSVMFYFYEQKKLLGRKLHQQYQLIEAQSANLAQVNGLKDKILAVIGHDLRTPIANLINISSLFESDDLSINEVQVLMKDITPVIRGAELTLSNLLDWAGSHIKGRSVTLADVDVYEVGVEMEQTFRHLLQRKNISFINCASKGQMVRADENHLKVVLRNLISNAIKFTENKGHITLTAECTGDRIIIGIADTGRGMSSEEIDKLFYLTTHFTAYGTRGEKGTGLGLILCRELVELNGGKMGVNSKQGEGTQFYFDLKAADNV